MKSIAIISNTSWSLYNFRKPLINDFLKKDYTVFCIAPFDEFSKKIENELGCTFIPLKKLNAKGSNLVEDFSLILEFKKIFKKYSFDYVFSYTAKPNIYGNLGGLFSNITFINTVNGLGAGLASNTFLSKIMRLIYKVAFLKSSNVIFQNNDDEAYFLEYKIIKKQKSIVVNGSGIEIDTFLQILKFNPDNFSLKFLLSARLVKEKGIIEYIEAANIIKEKYPKIEFIMCGLEADNPSSISIHELQAINKDNAVNYIGAHHNMNQLLEDIDVLVLPSYYREGVPRILLEGLSKGLPIITTNSVGCKETIIDGVNGYQIPIKNSIELANAFEKIINLPLENRIIMGNNSRKLAEEKFDVKKVNKIYLDLIK